MIDVFNSLCDDRPYRTRMHPAEARRYLIDQAGLLFDPEIVNEFVKMIDER